MEQRGWTPLEKTVLEAYVITESQFTQAFQLVREATDAELPDRIPARLLAESGALGTGTNRERIEQIILRVGARSRKEAGDVWKALQNPETRHQVERLFLIVSFFVRNNPAFDSWPPEALAALAMFAVSIFSKSGEGH